MRFRDTIIWFVCILLAIVLLVAAGLQLDYINSERYRMKLIINEPLENAPPSLAFATIAMGAFRGLVVDILWMRADKLKEEKQFFDAKQLAEWITVLQPRFASVWEFQAWNMAYNISVCMPATQPEERWRWVKNGYELLRDKGIVINPKSILLYNEISRIFQHKIGGVTDDAHKYYKLQLALGMEPLLGPADNQTFESLAKAPVSWKQMVSDANMVPLINALKSSDSEFLDEDKFVSNYLSLRQNPRKFKPEAFETIDDFRGNKALVDFDIFAKAYQLRKVWKLDPVLMDQLNKTYGPVDWNEPNELLPLDWRHANSHAIYWAVKGLKVAGKDEYAIAEANTDRVVTHALQDLFRNGKIFIYNIPVEASSDSSEQPKLRKEIFLRSDMRMFESYNNFLLKVIAKYKGISKSTSATMGTGHRNMLVNALFSFYTSGHRRQARKIYNQLRQLYPRKEFKVPLVVFVKKRLHEEISVLGINDAKEIIQMMLRESYFRYALHDDDEAFGREKVAKEVYDFYQAEYKDEDRINLPDFKLLRYFGLMDFLYDEQFPVNLRRSLLRRIEIERPELSEQLKEQQEKLERQYEAMQKQENSTK